MAASFEAQEAVRDLAEAIAAAVLPAIMQAVSESIAAELLASQSRARMPSMPSEAGAR